MGTPDDKRERLRVDRDTIHNTLEKLDAPAIATRRSDTRRGDRFKYRVREMTVDLLQPSGEWKCYASPSRNISSGGISFLIGHFVYPGTVVQVRLKSIYNHEVSQSGKVVRCRYLEGSARLHEVGVKFDAPIDVSMFHRGAVPTRILLVDDDQAIHKLISALLKDTNTIITSAYDGEPALEVAKQGKFDMALLDINLPGMDGITLAGQLRGEGFSAPLVAVTANDSQDSRKKCMEGGFDMWVTKPLTRNALTTLVTSMRSDPVISSLIHETDMADLIDKFAATLRTRVRDLHVLLTENNYEQLTNVVRSLRIDAGSYGFEPIVDLARELQELLSGTPELSLVRPKVNQLARLCNAARGVSCVEIPT